MNKSKTKGITLIALVITIIVLLILAGVTINAIIGNESSMEKAKQAQTENEKGNELDTIKLAVVDAITKESDGLVHLNRLNESLTGLIKEAATGDSPWFVIGNITEKIYKITENGQVELVKGVAFPSSNIKVKQGKSTEIEIINVTGEELTITPTTSSGITVTKGQNNKITFTAAQDATIGTKVTFTATAGTESDTCEVEVVFDKAGVINSKIGNNVYYTVSIEGQADPINKWQVFYADDENGEVFVISEDVLEKNTYIGGTNSTSNAAAYSTGAASNSLASTTYGGKYNKEWLKIENAGLTGTTVNNNAKTTAYLCDSTNSHWSRYASGTFGTGTEIKTASTIENVYAVGGPTMELLYASVKEHAPNKISTTSGTLLPNAIGYNGPFKNELSTPYKATDGIWSFASPFNNNADGIWHVNGNGNVSWGFYNNYGGVYGVRPLISIPLDSFDLNWIQTPTN